MKGAFLALLLLTTEARAQGVIGTFAGTEFLFPANRLIARDSPLGSVQDVALDAAGNLYISDRDNHVVLQAAPDGTLIVFAGNGLPGFSGDQGQAVNASLRGPQGLVIDAAGNLFVSDSADNRVRKVSPDGTITTVAGTGVAGFSGDGPATANQLNQPRGIAVDIAGNLYIADSANNRVRKVTPGGFMTTFAGAGVSANNGDGGSAALANLNTPAAVKLDAAGNVLVATLGAIRKIALDSTITTAFTANGGLTLNPAGLAIDLQNNLYVSEGSSQVVFKIAPGGGVTVVAGNGASIFSGDGGPAINASLNGPAGLEISPAGVLFVADRGNLRVRSIDLNGIVRTFAGNGNYRFSGDGQSAFSAAMRQPVSVATDSLGDVFIADLLNNRIRKITTGGIINTVAGNGTFGFSGDAGPAIGAALSGPQGVVANDSGFYIADRSNNRVRKVDLQGIINTIASGLRFPYAVALDAAGNLYIADRDNDRVIKVAPDLTVTTVAGSEILSGPQGVAVDAQNRIYIADTLNNLIRVVDGGKVTTVTPANSPRGLAVDAAGNLYFAEPTNNVVRRVSNGVVTIVAGVPGPGGYAGDGGLAVNALLSAPTGLAFDRAGNLYIADSNNNRIRKVFAAPPKVQVSPTTLTFSGISGGLRTAPRLLSISSNDLSGLPFTATLLNNSPWLKLFPNAGPIPATIEISADPSNLKSGNYQETIRIATPNAVPASTDVSVQFTVSDPGQPQQFVQPQSLSFAFVAGTAAKSQTLTVANLGGGTLSFTVKVDNTGTIRWLSVDVTSGTATPVNPASINVTANPSQLTPGTYTGVITVTGSTGPVATVPVTMTITTVPQLIRLSQTGMTFTAVAGGGVVPPQSFSVLNAGQGTMDWTATVISRPGAQIFLSLSPRAGTSIATSTNIPSVTVTADASNLAPGEYFNQIEVDSTTALNSPQFIPVVLEVLDPGQDPGPAVQPSELVFTGVAGTPPPGSQNLLVYNLKGATLNYRSQKTTANGKDWMVYLPTEAAVDPKAPTRIVLQPDTTLLLNPTVEQGVLSLSFNDGSTRKINVLTVVLPKATGSSGNSLSAAQAACMATDLVPSLGVLGQGFTVPAGAPNRLVVKVLDNCGMPMIDGRVSANFTNGDPPLQLLSLQDGQWTATWTPRTAAPVTVTITAESTTGLKKPIDISGSTRATKVTPPRINAGGVVNVANYAGGQPLAPGDMIAIFGTDLANGAAAAPKLPLDTTLAGTSVSIAGVDLPLFYSSPNQVNAVLPYTLKTDTDYQLLVTQGNLVSGTERIIIASAQPAIFLTSLGPAVVDLKGVLISASNPARIGDTLLIFAAGLGAVKGTVTPGAASDALQTASPLTVSIGNLNAPVSYAGLAPGFVGLYQVNAQVPAGVAFSDKVPLTLTIQGQTSAEVEIAIR